MIVVLPAGDCQPRRALVGRLEQFEPLEPLLIVNGAESRGKATSHLLTDLGGHGEGVDLDDGLISDHAMPATTSGGTRHSTGRAGCRDSTSAAATVAETALRIASALRAREIIARA